MKKIFNILLASAMTLAVGGSIVSCEDENIGLGSGLVGGDAEGNVASYDVIAYNERFDSLRSDQSVLQNALLGVFEEPVFGQTKASFITQIRLGTTSPTFGTNPTVDSVHLIIPTYVKSSTDSVRIDTLNLSKPGDKPLENDTILIRKTYKVDSIYGKKNDSITLKVRDINSVLYANKAYYSNDSEIGINSQVLGRATVSKEVKNNTIKLKNGSSNIYEELVGYKISLDTNYFRDKIVGNEKTGLLDDHATFIRRVIQGLEISVEENNGFLFAFNPTNIQLKMYYSNDATEQGKRNNYNIAFNLNNNWTSNGANVQVNKISHANQGQAFLNNLTNVDKTNGQARLFLNGSDGTRVNVKFIDEQINKLKADKEANNWTIIGAKLQFHIDDQYNFPKPGFIMGWNKFKSDGVYVDRLYDDMLDFANAYPYNVHFNSFVKKDDKFYTIDITKHIKNMIEKGETYEDQIMNIALGNFLVNSDATIVSANPFVRNTIANPFRIVLHGNATENLEKKLKLKVYYTKN